MSRQQPALGTPDPVTIGQVPMTRRRRPLWRACPAGRASPWWFSTRDQNPAPGRFDLADGRGTSYWALTAAGAILEATADPDSEEPPVISTAALSALEVWAAADVPAARSRLADTTRASVPGLTGELATHWDYTRTWPWADAFDAAGYTGILYRGRFAQDEAVALFGPAGLDADPPHAARRRALDHARELPPAMVATVGDLDMLEAAPEP